MPTRKCPLWEYPNTLIDRGLLLVETAGHTRCMQLVDSVQIIGTCLLGILSAPPPLRECALSYTQSIDFKLLSRI
jgi:hypothetical protein